VVEMTVNACVVIKRTDEIVEKLKRLGTFKKRLGIFKTSDYFDGIIVIDSNDFGVHNSKFDWKEPHLWYEVGEETYSHYPEGQKTAKVVSLPHGFEVYIEKDKLVFDSPAHWDKNHARQTVEDLKQWIKSVIGEVEIIESGVC
jgi:hypothetical protein